MANYDDRYVGFVDVLGFADLVGRSAWDETTQIQLVNAMHAVDPKQIKSRVSKWARPSEHFGASVFSDSIILYDEPSAEGLWSIIGRICTISMKLAQYGTLARGALTRGQLHASRTTRNQIVFGPALVKAVQLEETVAKYPRILIAREPFEDSQRYASEYEWAQELHKNFLIQDRDGPIHLNVFADLRSDLDSPDPDIRDAAVAVSTLIREKVERNLFDNMERPSIFEKYAWFAEEFNRFATPFLPPWDTGPIKIYQTQFHSHTLPMSKGV